MKIRLIGKNLNDIRPKLAEYGMTECETGFDFVVAHGGDGTLLLAEEAYPGVPKLAIRDSHTAPRCEEHSTEKLLSEFCAGKLPLTHLKKLCAVCCKETKLAVNDIFLHNFERTGALRYRVWIDDELYANEVVGDAVGISSVHGSTAYYKSITHSIFRVGIGLSFSNSTEEVNHLVLPETAEIRVAVVRGPGLLIADNSAYTITVPEGAELHFRQSKEEALVYGLRDFMCPKCRILRHPKKSRYLSYAGPRTL